MSEDRLSRWSRLKRKGGADAGEEKRALEERSRAAQAKAEAAPETVRLPGGARVRNFVPAMPPLAPEAEDDDDRLSRGVGHADDGAPQPSVPAPDAATPAPAADHDDRPLTPDEEKIVADLPAIESLTAESDLSPFMRAGVPGFIQRRALRAMWRVNPFFNIRDGLDDYDQDFNILHKDIAPDLGEYRVGKGFLSDQELRDMTPKEARRAFGEDIDEDETAGAAVEDAAEAVDNIPEQESGELGEISEDGTKCIKTPKNNTQKDREIDDA